MKQTKSFNFPNVDIAIIGKEGQGQTSFRVSLRLKLNNSAEYQPSGEGGTRSPPATPHRLQNPKWPPGGPKMADGVW